MLARVRLCNYVNGWSISVVRWYEIVGLVMNCLPPWKLFKFKKVRTNKIISATSKDLESHILTSAWSLGID